MSLAVARFYFDWSRATVVAFLSLATLAQSASVTLAWDPNTEPDIAGYKLYYGTPAGNFSEMINTGNVTNTTVSTLVEGNTYAFYVTCYNTSGLESEPSNVVEYTVPTVGSGENRAPLAFGHSVTATSGREIVIDLSGSDPDGDPLSFNISSFATSGEMPPYPIGGGTNATITYRSTPGFAGIDSFTFYVDDGYLTSADATVRIQVLPDDPPPTETYTMFLQAESGIVDNPLVVIADPGPVEASYVTTPTSNQGSATYAFDIPVAGNYVVWCRVRTATAGNDSFFVLADNDPATRDIYDAAWEQFSSEWQWSQLCGRGGVDRPVEYAYSIAPRVFPFAAGAHQLTFEGRERNTHLDALVVTSDLTFDPLAAEASSEPPMILSVSAPPASETRLSWSAIPGRNYRLLAKEDLSQTSWTPLPDLFQAGTDRVNAVLEPGPGNFRFFTVVLLP